MSVIADVRDTFQQEKVQKQQEYAERVAKKNKTGVKQKSNQYSKQQEQQAQSSHHKVCSRVGGAQGSVITPQDL